MIPGAIFRGRRPDNGGQTGDSELLRRYVEEGSEPAFAELVRRHLDLVYAAALRRLGGDAHAAADVAQQVFIALARQASALTRCPVLPGWLYTTTRNVAVDFIRAEQRRRAREQEAHTMEELNSPNSGDAAWAQMRPMLDAAMDELSNADREAVLLRFFARRPFGEIGTALNLSEDAARMRVERALDKLNAFLAKRGVTSTSSALAAVLANQAAATAPSGLVATITGAVLTQAAAEAATGGAVATIIDIMSTTKIPLTIIGVVGVIVVGVTVVRRPENRAAAPEEFQLASQSPNRPASFVPAGSVSPRTGEMPLPPKAKKAPVGGKAVGDEWEKLTKELSAPGNTFFDPEYRITGKYPEGWAIRESGRWGAKENNVRFLDPEHPNVWPTLYYRINSESSQLSESEIDQWLREEAARKAASRLRSGLVNYTNGDLVACTIGDRPALAWTATFAFHGTNPHSTTPRGDALEEHFTLIYSPNCTALFFVQASKADMAAVRPKFDEMIKSTVLP